VTRLGPYTNARDIETDSQFQEHRVETLVIPATMSFAKEPNEYERNPPPSAKQAERPTMFHTDTDALPIPSLLLLYPSTNI